MKSILLALFIGLITVFVNVEITIGQFTKPPLKITPAGLAQKISTTTKPTISLTTQKLTPSPTTLPPITKLTTTATPAPLTTKLTSGVTPTKSPAVTTAPKTDASSKSTTATTKLTSANSIKSG